MRRIRREFADVPAAGSRLAFAVVFSTAAHLVLIYGLALRPGSPTVTYPGPIHARLVPSESAPLQAKRKAVPILLPAAANATISPPDAASPGVTDHAVSSEQQPPGNAVVPETTGLPDPADLVHYPAKDLDVYPQLQSALYPDYPEQARTQKITGTVTLLVLIDEAGRVTGISVVDAVPEGLFEDSAQQALARAAFIPAQRDGRRVRSRVLVSVNYAPDEP
jgi:protein TonB